MLSKLLLIVVLLFLFIPPTIAQDLTGNWRWNSPNGQVVYSLTLNQISKDRYTGVHCVQNFKRNIEESFTPDQEITITLVKITENLFKGSLLNGIGKEREMHEIQVQYLPLEDRILFNLTMVPKKSIIIPLEAILHR